MQKIYPIIMFILCIIFESNTDRFQERGNSMTGLEIMEYNGEGYSPLVHFESWRVAIANYSDRFAERDDLYLERHLETDEVFVLLKGACILLIGEEAEEIEIEACKTYNVKKGVWHNMFLSQDASVLIIENDNTCKQNTEYMDIHLERGYKL